MNEITTIGKTLKFLEKLGFEYIPKIDLSLLNPKKGLLQSLRDEIGDCQRCRLSEKRTNILFGEGDPDSPLLFIGEAPDEEEDRQGIPFVGEAGQLLTRLIEKMGFKTEEVYIANIVKCRRPQNRELMEDEIKTCIPFLHKQIEIIKPSVIMALGSVATRSLLFLDEKKKEGITYWRGKIYSYQGIPVVPTFHPAYLLRNPKDKRLTWQDAQTVLSLLKEQKGKKREVKPPFHL